MNKSERVFGSVNSLSTTRYPATAYGIPKEQGRFDASGGVLATAKDAVRSVLR